MFECRQKLHERAADRFEESIDFDGFPFAGTTYDTHGIEFDPIFSHLFDSAHDFGESGFSGLVPSVGIMYGFRAVDGDPDQKVMFRKESAPIFVDQYAVCL